MTTPQRPKAKPLKGSRPRVLRIELSITTMVVIMLVVAGAWTLIQLLPVLLVLVTALILTGTLSPAVERLEARGVVRGLGIAIVFIALLLVTLLLLFLTVPALLSQAADLFSQEPAFRARVVAFLAEPSATAGVLER